MSEQTKIISEIINLEAILNLPKGTEHFVSDLHGEYEAFQHILRSGSGNVKQKVTAVFHQQLNQDEINDLCFLIYYPEEMLALNKEGTANWQKETIQRLVEIVRFSATKYTRSKVRKAIPENYQYILEELIYPSHEEFDKQGYYEKIIEKIVQLGQGEGFITRLCYLIQRLVVDHLHVVGDIYDRGPAPDKIMDTLIEHHSVDIQWGNHDMIWIGAYAGSLACLANVIRICARYSNLDLIEENYQINLNGLYQFAEKYYQTNPSFTPKTNPYRVFSASDQEKLNKVQQAIAIIQFKLEGQLMKRRPEFIMEGRLLLDKINYQTNTIIIDGVEYELKDTCFQTVDKENPYELTDEEEKIIKDLIQSFQQSKRLKKHITFLMEKGSLYLAYNGNLLIHGCIPLTEEGEFKEFVIDNKPLKGKELLDTYENYVKASYLLPHVHDDLATDLVWYLWCGENSSLFGKHAMTTFERYFIKDKQAHTEVPNPYYKMRNEEQACTMILEAFGLSACDGHIINGHTPVKEKKGETPIKAGGKMLVIDGGFSKAYQKTTGMGGYTLLYNSYGIQLVAHQAFISKEDAIANNRDIISIKRAVARKLERKKVRDTNIGENLLKRAENLMKELGNLKEGS